MRRLWYATALALFLAALCLLAPLNTRRHCAQLTALLESAEESARISDWVRTEEICLQLQQDFLAWLPLARCHLSHAELQPLEESFRLLTVYCTAEEQTDFLVTCQQAQTGLCHLADAERPTPDHIL